MNVPWLSSDVEREASNSGRSISDPSTVALPSCTVDYLTCYSDLWHWCSRNIFAGIDPLKRPTRRNVSRVQSFVSMDCSAGQRRVFAQPRKINPKLHPSIHPATSNDNARAHCIDIPQGLRCENDTLRERWLVLGEVLMGACRR